MKLRPDLVSMVLTGVAVVAITALAGFHVPIPDVLPVRPSARLACSEEPGYKCAPMASRA